MRPPVVFDTPLELPRQVFLMPPPDHFSVYMDQVLKTWRIQLIKAQHFSDDESALYALIDNVLNTFAFVIDTDDDTTISCHPQSRLSGNNAYEHILSLTAAISVIPDFALILDHLRGSDFDYSRVLLLFEIKRLIILPPSPKSGLTPPKPSWFDLQSSLAAGGDFSHHLDQVMLQGFVGWHVYKQDIYLVLVIGIYYTVLYFTLPTDASLVPLPTHPSKIDLIASELVPRKHQPKPIIFMKPMFERRLDGTVELADSFRRLLHLGLLRGKGILPASARSCSLFHLDNPSEMDFNLTTAEQDDCFSCELYINLWYDNADESRTAGVPMAMPQTPGGRLNYAEPPLSPGNVPTPEQSPYVPPRQSKKRRLSKSDASTSRSHTNRRVSFFKDGMTQN